MILGHQIVGADRGRPPRRRPVAGLDRRECRYCTSGRENLCVNARFTGRDIDGGFAELTVADERYCLPLPDELTDEQAAPLLCGGLIGYRALRFTGDAHAPRPYGFGSAAHMICQVAVHQGREVFAFTRPGDERTQEFARSLGATWAGGSDEPPPEAARRGDHLRARRRARPRSAGGARARGHRRLRRNPHDRHPVVPIRGSVARAHDPLGRQPDPRRTADEFLALAHQVPVRTTDHDLPARARPSRRSPTCAPDGSKARP